MKKHALLLLLSAVAAGSASADCPQINWSKIQKHAPDVTKLLRDMPAQSPMGTSCVDYESGIATLDAYFMSIKNDVDAGSPAALRLAIRLTGYTDGELAERYSELASSRVRKNAGVFLEQLREAYGADEFCAPVSYLGEEFVDKPEESKAELQARAKAIEAVKSPRLAKLRAACLKLLGEAR